MSDTYEALFVLVEEAKKSEPSVWTSAEGTPEELAELDEIRRLVMEITEPEPASYTAA